MLEQLTARRVRVSRTELFLRLGGAGPPVLLLHGYPQTHAIWHHVAPSLAERFTVVCPDLPGYGQSGRPPSDSTHVPHAKRQMAQDMVELMAALGHPRFAVVGHDRGARVAYRLALDHPARVSRLVSLDVVPTLEQWRRFDMTRALGGFHWPLLAQPAPLPERLIGHDPDFFLEWLLRAWAAPGFEFDAAALDAYRRAFRDPEVIHATCEDYRAGATVDFAHDRADREAGRRVACPVLVLWGGRDTTGKPTGRMVDIWHDWADEVTGHALPCGHFLPEEAPEALLAALLPFLAP